LFDVVVVHHHPTGFTHKFYGGVFFVAGIEGFELSVVKKNLTQGHQKRQGRSDGKGHQKAPKIRVLTHCSITKNAWRQKNEIRFVKTTGVIKKVTEKKDARLPKTGRRADGGRKINP
jgi:hypothetical protein